MADGLIGDMASMTEQTFRMLETVAEYNLVGIFMQGKRHQVADALSWFPYITAWEALEWQFAKLPVDCLADKLRVGRHLEDKGDERGEDDQEVNVLVWKGRKEILPFLCHLWDWLDQASAARMERWSAGNFSDVKDRKVQEAELEGFISAMELEGFISMMELDEAIDFTKIKSDPTFHQMIVAVEEDNDYQLLLRQVRGRLPLGASNLPRNHVMWCFKPYWQDMCVSTKLVFFNDQELVLAAMRGEIVAKSHKVHGSVHKCLSFMCV